MNRYLVPAAVLTSLAIAWPSAAPADQPDVDPAITSGKAAKDFSAARDKWLSSGTTSYRFKISAYCFCPYTGLVRVTVRGKRKTVSNPHWFGPRSVPAMFKVIHGAIQRDAASLSVVYDERDGHPTSISIDYNLQMVDEEMGYKVKGFSRQ